MNAPGFALEKGFSNSKRQNLLAQGCCETRVYGVSGFAAIGTSEILKFWEDEPATHIFCVIAQNDIVTDAVRIFSSYYGVFLINNYNDQAPKRETTGGYFIANNAVTGEVRETTVLDEIARLCRLSG